MSIMKLFTIFMCIKITLAVVSHDETICDEENALGCILKPTDFSKNRDLLSYKVPLRDGDCRIDENEIKNFISVMNSHIVNLRTSKEELIPTDTCGALLKYSSNLMSQIMAEIKLIQQIPTSNFALLTALKAGNEYHVHLNSKAVDDVVLKILAKRPYSLINDLLSEIKINIIKFNSAVAEFNDHIQKNLEILSNNFIYHLKRADYIEAIYIYNILVDKFGYEVIQIITGSYVKDREYFQNIAAFMIQLSPHHTHTIMKALISEMEKQNDIHSFKFLCLIRILYMYTDKEVVIDISEEYQKKFVELERNTEKAVNDAIEHWAEKVRTGDIQEDFFREYKPSSFVPSPANYFMPLILKKAYKSNKDFDNCLKTALYFKVLPARFNSLEAIFEKMRLNTSDFHSYNMLKLLYHFKYIEDNHEKQIIRDIHLNRLLKEMHEKYPSHLKELIWSRSCRMKNVLADVYLGTSETKRDTKGQHRVSIESTVQEEDYHFDWRFDFQDNQYGFYAAILNLAENEFLEAPVNEIEEVENAELQISRAAPDFEGQKIARWLIIPKDFIDEKISFFIESLELRGNVITVEYDYYHGNRIFLSPIAIRQNNLWVAVDCTS